MAGSEPRLIESYLAELRVSLGNLPDADDVVDEAADHLFEAVDRLRRDGVDPLEAEVRALGRYGSAALVSRAFVEEARKGGAVATMFTRRAGAAAAAVPVLAVLAAAADVPVDDGPLNSIGIALWLAAGALALIGFLGLRVRHAGTGALGKAALALTLAAIPVSLPWGYAGLVVLAVCLGAAFLLWGAAIFRAGVLPRLPTALFAFSGVVFGAAAWAVTAAGGDANVFAAVPVVTTLVGFGWLGLAMWQEAAVELPQGPTPLPA